MAAITINGVTYQGTNVQVKNNQVYIDGKIQTPEDAKEINISVEGNIKKLDVDACDKVEIKGSVGDVKTMYGDVDVEGDVSGSIKTMSGDVDCYDVEGSVTTMSGDIKHRKSK